MKKLLLLVALLLLPTLSFSASIVSTSVFQDVRRYDTFFSQSDVRRITALADVDYQGSSYDKDNNLPHLDYVPTGRSQDMFYDGTWPSGNVGFYLFVDSYAGSSSYSDFLSKYSGTYSFELNGVPASSVNFTVPTGAFDEGFGYVDPTISNGIVSWDAVANADKYRVRLYSLLADGSVGDPLGRSSNITDTMYDLTTLTGWDPTKDLALAVEAREYMDNSDWGSIMVNRSRYYTVVEGAPIPTPEPSTFLLLGGGLAGLWFGRKKFQK